MMAAMTCQGAECATAMTTTPAMPAIAAAASTALAPKRSMNRPLINATRNPVSAPGSKYTTLAVRTLAPKPYPAASRGIWTNFVRPRNAKYSPIPTNTVARFVSRIGRRLSIRVDTRGCVPRRSQSHQPTITTTPATAHPSVHGEVHPHESPWVIANRTADSPAARPAAPSQSIDPVERGSREGTTNSTTTMTRIEKAVVSQKTRWYPAAPFISSPVTTSPAPPPKPNVPESTDIALTSRSGGNSSRMMATLIGYRANEAP